MANRTIVSHLLAVAIALSASTVANAETLPISTSDHVEALCHSWTETPCLLRVGGWIRSVETGAPLGERPLVASQSP